MTPEENPVEISGRGSELGCQNFEFDLNFNFTVEIRVEASNMAEDVVISRAYPRMEPEITAVKSGPSFSSGL